MVTESQRSPASPPVGVVVIGRNEGDRLRACLESVRSGVAHVVYVDSGSTDGSVELAQRAGATVCNLDMSSPFTAARARNTGFAALLAERNDLSYVQFIDGDTTLVEGWLMRAAAHLHDNAKVAAVCGRLRERYPDASVYNRLCDYEWERPAGLIAATGGIFMIRAAAFVEVGGFRAEMYAGEEPELCSRLRQAGWTIWSLPDPMGLHDAAMMRFAQWWHRNRRAGFAAALLVGAPGFLDAQTYRRRNRWTWAWVAAVPTIAVIGALAGQYLLSGAALSVYPLQVVRIAWRQRGNWKRRLEVSTFLLAAKVPYAVGLWQFWTITPSRPFAYQKE